jgi:hypothetical protein
MATLIDERGDANLANVLLALCQKRNLAAL